MNGRRCQIDPAWRLEGINSARIPKYISGLMEDDSSRAAHGLPDLTLMAGGDKVTWTLTNQVV